MRLVRRVYTGELEIWLVIATMNTCTPKIMIKKTEEDLSHKRSLN
jgi:hypothetical protein